MSTPNPAPAASSLPRITIVISTIGDPSLLHPLIEDTIRSVVQQTYPNLECIIVGNDETAAMRQILEKYNSAGAWLPCPPGTELCAALNLAFAKSTGEILGWLEPGDMLHINGLPVVGGVFSAFPDIEWITGRPFNFSPSGLPTGMKHLERWSRIRFLAGGNKYIHRDTTFWRRSLWERAGGQLSTAYGLNGEFDLFLRFFRHAKLYSVDALIGGYRTHPGNHSATGSHRHYNKVCDEIADRELATVRGAYAAKFFRQLTRIVAHIPKLRSLWHKHALQAIYRCPGPDWHPQIVCLRDKWTLRP